jgi:hypothetical protein
MTTLNEDRFHQTETRAGFLPFRRPFERIAA